MKIFIDKRFIPRQKYTNFINQFPQVNFVHDLESNTDIEVFFGLNATLLSVDLSAYKDLKWIQLYMAGFDNVDVEGLKNRGIKVTNARDIFSITIAEDIIAKISYFNRNTREFHENMKVKKWDPIPKDHEIWNSTISIIGTGSIGQETAKRLQAFQPKQILGHRTKKQAVPYFDKIFTGDDGLDKVIKEADYLILALPLNENTKHLIDKDKLKLMKKDALLINVARGEIIKQEDLVEILEKGMIRGAALDVTDPEPLPSHSKLWNLKNCYITPHNASSSMYMKDRLIDLTMDNLSRYLNDQKLIYLL